MSALGFVIQHCADVVDQLLLVVLHLEIAVEEGRWQPLRSLMRVDDMLAEIFDVQLQHVKLLVDLLLPFLNGVEVGYVFFAEFFSLVLEPIEFFLKVFRIIPQPLVIFLGYHGRRVGRSSVESGRQF